MDKVLSIGIPVYNVKEEYLRACLDSAVKDKSEQIEILVVDDCSKNQSADICSEYAEKDQRIKFIRLAENRGVSFVRNMIINEACGKWLCFLDADDLLCDGFCQSVISNECTDADIVYYNYRTIGANEKCSIKSLYMPLTELNKNEIKNLCVCHLCTIPSRMNDMILAAGVVTKIFRLSFIKANRLRFIEQLIKSEDRLFMINALSLGPRVYFSEQMSYLYRINPDSATNRYNSKIMDATDAYLKHSEEIVKKVFEGGETIETLFLENRVTTAILDNMELNIFHSRNPQSYSDRKKSFFKLLEKEPYKNAIENAQIENYEIREKRILLQYARKRCFFVLNILYRWRILLKIHSAFLNRCERLSIKVRKALTRMTA